MSELWRRIQYLLQRKKLQREFEEEMSAHREEMGNERARSFGSSLKLREDANDAWGFGWLDRLWQDIHFGVRLLRRSPGFTLTAVIILAFGIGLNVSAFSFLNVAILKPLPVKEPHTLMRLTRTSPQSNSTNVSYPSFDFYRRNNRVFSSMLAMSGTELVSENGERLSTRMVTPNFFEELGSQPAYGRLFRSDDKEPGLVILSYALFERRFGGDPSIVGKRILLNRKPALVIGVAAYNFVSLDPSKVELYATLEDHPYFFEQSQLLTSAEMQPLHAYGRLKPGISPQAAEDAMRPVVQARAKESPTEIWKDEWLDVEPGAYIGRVKDKILIPMIMIGMLVLLVLATACANLGNLLLARGILRERELSIRSSVGASRWRLVRQLLTESLMLAILGSAVGLALSVIATRILVRRTGLPDFIDASPDWRVLLFAFGVALLAAIFFGLAPALQVTRKHNPNRANRTRFVLAAVQVAASCLLMILSGLLLRGLQNALSVDPGFYYHESALIDPNLAGLGTKGQQAKLYFDELKARVTRIAGVEAVGLATIPPLGNRASTRRDPVGTLWANDVSPDFFDAMRIPILRGRTFQPGDRDAVIVSQRLASKLFPDQDAVGKEYAARDGSRKWSIVGVSGNAAIVPLGDSESLEIYFPLGEDSIAHAVMIVRTANVNGVRKTLQQTAEELDSKVMPRVDAIRESLDQKLSGSKTAAIGIGSLGVVALVLAVVGIGGLISFSVRQRTKEIGIRMALGASRSEVIRVGFSQLVMPVAIGLIIGVLGAAGFSQVLRRELYGLSGLDPWSYLGTPVLFALLAALSSAGPLLRASRVDPMIALRHD